MVTFLAIDAGTTALKAALFDLDGRLLALDRQEYMLLTPAPAMVELDAEMYWQACCRAVRAVVARAGAPVEEIASLAISSQGETLVAVDESGIPTRPAIVWLDNRAVEEARLITEHFDAVELYSVTGQPEVTPTWPACKIFWIKRCEPEVFARTAHFFLLEDYLVQRITGQCVAGYGLYTSSLLLDIRAKRWWPPMLDFIDVTPERLGRLTEPGAPIGPLSREGAAALGLSTRTLAVTGAMDQAVGAVGAGNIAPGVVSETTGGAMAILATLDRPLYDPLRRVPCHYHARSDAYCLLPWVQTAGMALKWLRDEFFPLETAAARAEGRDPYDTLTTLAADVSAGCEGLTVLPHLEGATCPEFDPAARAVFYGATLRHTRAHFVRGVMEAVAFALKRNLEIVEQLGVAVSEVRSMGGGARSSLWLQIKADVLQKPVIAVEVEEAACLGAAILGAAATGYVGSLEEGVARMVRLREPLRPNPAHAEVYERAYARYVELYERLRPMSHS